MEQINLKIVSKCLQVELFRNKAKIFFFKILLNEVSLTFAIPKKQSSFYFATLAQLVEQLICNQ